MGQEASLPADGDDLEELAPPSHTTAGLPASSGHHHGGGKASKVPQKMLNMMRAFEQSNRGDDSLQKMESTESGAIPTNSAHSATNGNSNTASSSSSSTTKASLFRPTVAARGVISQMRSLRINKQSSAMSEKQKVAGAQDWEKQWYADDDDDDDDSDDEGDDTAAVSPQQPAGGGGGGYGSSAAIPPGTGGGIVTPTNAAMARPGLDVGPHGSLSNVHLVTPPDLASTRGASSQILAYSEASVGQQQYQHHQQHHHIDVHMQPEEVFTGVVDPLGKKPDVSMFLPMLRVLGKGSFGKVVLVQKREGKDHGHLFAMKILKKTHLVKRRQIERTRTERKVLSVVNHPFIMKLHYAFQTDTKLYLVLDYCPGGELFFHLSRFRRFPERVARFYAAELLLAIGHLHKRGIIYRDLKPENVLLDADGHVKLGDFGLAKAGIQHPYEGATSMCGTPEYMAPEVLAQLGHGFCVDYWGLGMIVYEMMTGLPPWYTTDRQQLFRRLKSAPLDVPSYFSAASADFVSALLERNPRRRLGVTGIRVAMEHEYFKSVSWRSLYTRRLEAPIRPCEGWNPDSTDAQNFDAQFTRMPVESDDSKELENAEELNENTFLGFSFDILSEKERHRTQNLHLASPGEIHPA